jgi:hypothetical protein
MSGGTLQVVVVHATKWSGKRTGKLDAYDALSSASALYQQTRTVPVRMISMTPAMGRGRGWLSVCHRWYLP